MCLVVLYDHWPWRRRHVALHHLVLVCVLLVTITYVTVRFIVGPQLRYSVFYRDPDAKDILAQEARRRVEAEKWARQFEWKIPPVRTDEGPRPLCLAYVTAPVG